VGELTFYNNTLCEMSTLHLAMEKCLRFGGKWKVSGKVRSAFTARSSFVNAVICLGRDALIG